MTSPLALEEKYCAKNYKPLPVAISRGEGVWLYDTEGNKYLDMMSAYSAVSHGHSNPRLVKVLCDQAKQVAVTSRAFHSDRLGPLMEKICILSGLDLALPMNTGAEAVETAIKAARRWGYMKKGIPDGKARIITAENNFHGRTTTIVGFSSKESARKDFGPFTPGFDLVPFGDADAVAAAITEETCAVMVEPIQGEAGIIVPPDDYLFRLRKICDEHNVLLVLDEVQSGIGRTGKMFAFEHAGIKPDLLILGKALGGGLLPVSAVAGIEAVMGLFDNGSHGSTFGGNPLASRVALEALNMVEEEGLCERSARLGTLMMDRLRAVDSPLITNVRGIGLWIGVDFDPHSISGRDVCVRLKDNGMLSKETRGQTIRIAPPLVITEEELKTGLEIFTNTIRALEKELL